MAEFASLIKTEWNNKPINHEPIQISLEPLKNELVVHFRAPFFNSPQKPKENIDEFFNLWDYEVVEAFFLNKAGEYIELEFGPYGHHIGLTFGSDGKVVTEGLKFEYKSNLNGSVWTGTAIIPKAYFPCDVTRWNAYAIHGEGEDRVYESLFPVTDRKSTKPNFHRLEYFKAIEIGNLFLD